MRNRISIPLAVVQFMVIPFSLLWLLASQLHATICFMIQSSSFFRLDASLGQFSWPHFFPSSHIYSLSLLFCFMAQLPHPNIKDIIDCVLSIIDFSLMRAFKRRWALFRIWGFGHTFFLCFIYWMKDINFSTPILMNNQMTDKKQKPMLYSWNRYPKAEWEDICMPSEK